MMRLFKVDGKSMQFFCRSEVLKKKKHVYEWKKEQTSERQKNVTFPKIAETIENEGCTIKTNRFFFRVLTLNGANTHFCMPRAHLIEKRNCFLRQKTLSADIIMMMMMIFFFFFLLFLSGYN